MPATPTVVANMESTYDLRFYPSSGAIHHEDFTDIVTILDSFQSPFFSGAKKFQVRDMVHSWTVDTLSATVTAGVSEGLDFSADALTRPARLSNTLQLFRRDVMVSDRERESNPAGIQDMYEHQIMKEFKVLVRNFESRVFATGTTSASGAEATGNAPLMGGFRYFDLVSGAAGNVGVTTANVVTLARRMYEAGAEPDSLWFAPRQKIAWFNSVTSGQNVNVRNIAAADQALVANIEVFESPLGFRMVVITDRFIPESTTSGGAAAFYMGDRSMASVGFFRRPQHKPMGKGGDHTRGIVLFEATLRVDHPSAWGEQTAITS